MTSLFALKMALNGSLFKISSLLISSFFCCTILAKVSVNAVTFFGTFSLSVLRRSLVDCAFLQK